MTSLVSEFNHSQAEAGKGTIYSTTAISWLKTERPKTTLYSQLLRCPCDSQGVTNKQSVGFFSQEMLLLQCESMKKTCESGSGQTHYNIRNMTQKCAQRLKEIVKLEKTPDLRTAKDLKSC